MSDFKRAIKSIDATTLWLFLCMWVTMILTSVDDGAFVFFLSVTFGSIATGAWLIGYLQGWRAGSE